MRVPSSSPHLSLQLDMLTGPLRSVFVAEDPVRDRSTSRGQTLGGSSGAATSVVTTPRQAVDSSSGPPLTSAASDRVIILKYQNLQCYVLSLCNKSTSRNIVCAVSLVVS